MRHLVAIALLALLGGCGQTGPLYLPGEKHEPPPATGAESEESKTDTEIL